MRPPHLERPVTLGIHPTSRGFGWTAFEGPFHLIDHGLFTPRQKEKNAACLTKVEELLKRHQPETLVLEAFDVASSLRSPRIRRLCLAIVAHAADAGHEVTVFTRSDVQAAFAPVGARTREEIAQAVLTYAAGLRHRLPRKRLPWAGEDKRLSIFSAAALVLTHYHFGMNRLFDDLRGDDA